MPTTFSQWEIRFVSVTFPPGFVPVLKLYQNRWDVETVKRVAVEVVNNIANREDEVAHFLGVEAVDELTGDHRVVLEQHNVLHLVDHEVSVFESPVAFTL